MGAQFGPPAIPPRSPRHKVFEHPSKTTSAPGSYVLCLHVSRFAPRTPAWSPLPPWADLSYRGSRTSSRLRGHGTEVDGASVSSELFRACALGVLTGPASLSPPAASLHPAARHGFRRCHGSLTCGRGRVRSPYYGALGALGARLHQIVVWMQLCQHLRNNHTMDSYNGLCRLPPPANLQARRSRQSTPPAN